MSILVAPTPQILLPPLHFPRWLKGVRDEAVARFGSAMGQGVFPQVMGGGGAFSGTLILDNFTDSNGTNLNAHTIAPTNVPSTTWTIDSGTVTIQGNAANNSGTTLSEVSCQSGYSTGLTVTSTTSQFGTGLRLRSIDVNNYWLFYQDGSNYYIYEKTAGAFTLRATGTGAISGAKALSFNAVGTLLTAKVNGANTLTFTSSAKQSATRVGMYFTIGINGSQDAFTVTIP